MRSRLLTSVLILIVTAFTHSYPLNAIRGTVVDQEGSCLSGATVILEDSSAKDTTENGEFTLPIETENSPHRIRVSHQAYDSTGFKIKNPEKPVQILMYRKLHFRALNSITIGETLSKFAGEITLSFDSIAVIDCDFECRAKLHFTLTISNKTHQITFDTRERPETKVGNYTVHVSDFTYMKQGNSKPAIINVNIAVFPEDTKPVLFISKSESVTGKVIRGHFRGPSIDGPGPSRISTYSRSRYYKEIDDSIRVIFEYSKSLSGAAGTGNKSGMILLSTLPYTYNNDFSIDRMEVDGTVELTFEGEKIRLEPDSSWKKENRHFIDTPEQKADFKCEVNFSNSGYLMPHELNLGF